MTSILHVKSPGVITLAPLRSRTTRHTRFQTLHNRRAALHCTRTSKSHHHSSCKGRKNSMYRPVLLASRVGLPLFHPWYHHNTGVVHFARVSGNSCPQKANRAKVGWSVVDYRWRLNSGQEDSAVGSRRTRSARRA